MNIFGLILSNKGASPLDNDESPTYNSDEEIAREIEKYRLSQYTIDYCLDKASLDENDKGFNSTIDRLIKEGAKLNTADKEGNTVFADLCHAFIDKTIDDNAFSEIISYLIRKATEQNFYWNTPNKHGIAPLHLAKAFGYDSLPCFTNNHSVNTQSKLKFKFTKKDKSTQLAEDSSQLGSLVLELLEKKYVLPIPEQDHSHCRQLLLYPQPALCLTARNTIYLHLVELLIKESPLNEHNKPLINANITGTGSGSAVGNSPLSESIQELTFDKNDSDRRALIHYISLLLTLGADPNLPNKNAQGNTPLGMVAIVMSSITGKALDSFKIILRLLLHFDGRPNEINHRHLRSSKAYQDLDMKDIRMHLEKDPNNNSGFDAAKLVDSLRAEWDHTTSNHFSFKV